VDLLELRCPNQRGDLVAHDEHLGARGADRLAHQYDGLHGRFHFRAPHAVGHEGELPEGPEEFVEYLATPLVRNPDDNLPAFPVEGLHQSRQDTGPLQAGELMKEDSWRHG